MPSSVSLVHRYYDPSTGQFLSVDPAVDVTGTPYAYTGGDPVNGTDPTGLWWCLPAGESGPCPPGYTPGPPFGMSFPQPQGSHVHRVSKNRYALTLSDGEESIYGTNGSLDLSSSSCTAATPSPGTFEQLGNYLNNGGALGVLMGNNGPNERASNDIENADQVKSSIDNATYPYEPEGVSVQFKIALDDLGGALESLAGWLENVVGALG